MSIQWTAFTPGTALAGGLLIGLAASVMVLFLGRIAGISGIAGALLQRANWRSRSQWGWRLAFVAGLLSAPLLWQFFAALPAMQMRSAPATIVLAGLLVGFGTRLGSGCTSGHGVCGIARFSLRSVAATLTFMATAALTVFWVRHAPAPDRNWSALMIALIAYLAGLLFGLGLLVSGMGNPEKVLNFLDFWGHWDPSLLLVMVAAIGSSSLAFAWARRRSNSLLKEPMRWPVSNAIDSSLLSGAALFGIGWGLTGLCPGPALMNLAILQAEVCWFVAAMVLGMLLAHRYTQQRPQASQ